MHPVLPLDTSRSRILAGICALSLFSYTACETHIFDFHGVLATRDSWTHARYGLGVWTLIYHVVGGGTLTGLRERFFQILELDGVQPDNQAQSCAEDGRALPLIMYKWQLGQITSEEARQRAHALISIAQEWNFISPPNVPIMHRIADCAFDAQLLAKAMVPNPKALALLQKLDAAGHTLAIASNMAPDAARIIEEAPHLQEIMHHFPPQNRIFSGDIGYAKPDPRFFQEVAKRLGCDKQQCFFYDDQKENVAAARINGIEYAFVWQ